MISKNFHDLALKWLAQIAALRGGQADPDLNVAFTLGGGYLSWAGLPIAPLPSFASPAAPLDKNKNAGPAQ